jgi:UDP-N-acetylglucosamine 2-epimerase (non-hydrolysing)
MSPSQGLAQLTARCLEGITAALERYRPDCVVAQGDTTTAMSAALAAFYLGVRFAHVEAGLRTGDPRAPWPEEVNRRIASLAAWLHCAPTPGARENLLAEGVGADAIAVTGNTVVDALLATIERERRRTGRWAAKYARLGDRPVVLVTGHRRENFGRRFQNICRAISRLADRFPGVEFVYPVHLNPNVGRPARAALQELRNVHLTPPVPYPEFVWLMDRCRLILSDSGGVQEEAPSLGKPVVLMRDATERMEAVEAGAAVLTGAETAPIVRCVSRLLTDESAYRTMQIDSNPFGDGRAGPRIVDLITRRLAPRRRRRLAARAAG